MSRAGQKVLVTGGAGVIGLALLKLLDRSGAEVMVLDRKKCPSVPGNVEYIRADIAKDALNATVSKFDPTVTFHLAATFERSEESCEFWGSNYWNNVVLTHRLLSALSNSPSDMRLVFASSYLIYDSSLYFKSQPKGDPIPLKEDTKVSPRNLCGAAKYYNEKEIQFLAEKTPGLDATCARIFRVYGEGSKDVVSRWVRAAEAHETITVFNKENHFDYVFAPDVAEALLRLSDHAGEESVVNVGSGTPTPISKVVETIRSHYDDLSVNEVASSAPWEMSCADVGRLQRLTGWKPLTQIGEGVDRVVRFEKAAKGV